MEKLGIKSAIFGFLSNFFLFLLKLYIGISSGSLAVYCDSINNLADTLSCTIAFAGFILIMKLDEKRGTRVQALSTFVISLVLMITGAYFAYNGMERTLYPINVSFSKIYFILLILTVFVKILMGIVYIYVNKKHSSTVFKGLIVDSFLDCAITLAAILGFTLSVKINFAIDGIISIIIGLAVAISSVKTAYSQAKFLIND